ncbi:MAG: CHRD domain-containing protein [Pseudomonadota bacterium]
MTFKKLLAAAGTIAFAAALPTTAVADNDKSEFASTTILSAAQEVAEIPVVSNGFARATIRFDRGFSEARIRVRFNSLEGGVTRLHLHCNVAGANGPIAIGLIDTIAAVNDNSDVITLAGHRITGTITNADFPEIDPCPDVVGRPINNIASLAAAIDAGLVYWNLHTTAFGPGELRGQVRPTKERY